MEMNVQVPFQQLLELVKKLAPSQKARLRKALAAESEEPQGRDDFMDFLLRGPVYSEKDIAVIEENRKSIAERRTKD